MPTPIKPGKLISVEGVDACGKGSQIAAIHSHLEAAGHTVVQVREPGGTPIGEQLREVLLDSRNQALDPMTELLLMAASRAQLVAEVIAPALARGDCVLADRFHDSGHAYQYRGRGLPLAHVEALENMALGDLRPDLTLLLDLPVSTSLERMGHRGHATGAEKDRIELEAGTLFERVRAGYLERADQEPGRIKVLDARQSIEAVRQAALGHVDALLEAARNPVPASLRRHSLNGPC
ncbi:dTMP kinase [Vreelandella rituensis]|uniref:Thymidylate kinase n=1 Tax=Vreelandella rituensis TaxID=2282306 RepID=A0A368U9H9_9GAMM|nr:dTMP kinase [Halomonas rituensis]RCV93879.1 dTMP kinase [Halomonas rituensis]